MNIEAKNPLQSISKSNTIMYRKNYTPQPRVIQSRYARLVQHLKSIDKIHHINRLRRKTKCSYRQISHLKKNSTPIHDKNSQHIINKRVHPQLIKNTCKQQTSKLMERNQMLFSLKSVTRQGYFLSPLLFNIILQVLTNAITQTNKWHKGWKRRNQTVFVHRLPDCLC